MPSTAPTIYATKVVGHWEPSPGTVNVALGLDGFGSDKAETVLRLALPTDTARALSEALRQEPAMPARAPVSQKPAAPSASKQPGGEEAALQNALAISGLFAFQELLTLAASDRSFSRRLPEFEKQLVRKARETVASGVAEQDVKAMHAAIGSLETIFRQVRATTKAR